MTAPHLQCDASAIGRYLAQQLSAEEEAALEEHLTNCGTCRRLLDDSAADESWWSDASRFLPADEWDGPPVGLRRKTSRSK